MNSEKADKSKRSMLSPVMEDKKDLGDRRDVLQLPVPNGLLSRLYNNHGVRVRMVRRKQQERISTVRELIDHLSHKSKLLMPEAEAAPSSASSSSTPTVPFSTADLLYNSEGRGDEYGNNEFYNRDKEKVRSRDFDIAANRRPTSRSDTKRSFSLDKGRDPDELVAMGTIWSPNAQQRNTSTSGSNTNSGSGKSLGVTASSQACSIQPRRMPNVTTTTRQILVQQAGAPPPTASRPPASREVEPKYADPIPGAPGPFQQRIMELASLEGETVRWERTRKIKKKPKPEKDS